MAVSNTILLELLGKQVSFSPVVTEGAELPPTAWILL